jgi:hypothetical protein
VHLGARGDRSVLRDPGCLRVLCDTAAGADRLVLLGDVLELRERPLRDVLDDARPALEAIGSALAGREPSAEIVLLAGNHDHRLVEPWLRRRDRSVPLGVEAEVTPAAGDPLAAVVAALGMEGAAVSVRYPGVHLDMETWATHGHYADRHTTVPILERLSAGAMARLTASRDPRQTEDYEAALAPVYAWADALAEHTRGERGTQGSQAAWRALSGRGGTLRRRAARAAFPVAIAALNRAGLGPVRADLSREALRRGPLVALGEVLGRLEVGARRVVFGHTHRAGPLSDDDVGEWITPSGARLVNTGCWVRERGLVAGNASRSPYRPGWVVWVDGDPARAPELVNVLD